MDDYGENQEPYGFGAAAGFNAEPAPSNAPPEPQGPMFSEQGFELSGRIKAPSGCHRNVMCKAVLHKSKLIIDSLKRRDASGSG